MTFYSKMVSITVMVFVVSLLNEVFSYDQTTVGDLPSDIQDDLFKILHGTTQPRTKCDPPQESDVKFLLYTRNNVNNPIALNPSDPSQLDPSKKTVLIAHGWISGPTYIGVPELKDAYLQRYDCNLIIIDWSKVAWQAYATSRCQLPTVGQIVANFLCLIDHEVHIIGHSMGAQLAGFIGQSVASTCGGKVERITGLDPAGFLFQGFPPSDRLDATDAEFVDVIHTNEFMFGYWGNCGDVDFHVNCGIIQRGCPDFNITNIENVLVATVICSHVRALYYMAESANSDKFIAQSCSGCPLACAPDASDVSYIIMGEGCPSNPPKRNYWIPTRKSAPYAYGCEPYPLSQLITVCM